MKSLDLKWGTLKGWKGASEADKALLNEFFSTGVPMSAMVDINDDRTREIICTLIDNTEGDIWNCWDGEVMSKDAAKRYVMEYRR